MQDIVVPVAIYTSLLLLSAIALHLATMSTKPVDVCCGLDSRYCKCYTSLGYIPKIVNFDLVRITFPWDDYSFIQFEKLTYDRTYDDVYKNGLISAPLEGFRNMSMVETLDLLDSTILKNTYLAAVPVTFTRKWIENAENLLLSDFPACLYIRVEEDNSEKLDVLEKINVITSREIFWEILKRFSTTVFIGETDVVLAVATREKHSDLPLDDLIENMNVVSEIPVETSHLPFHVECLAQVRCIRNTHKKMEFKICEYGLHRIFPIQQRRHRKLETTYELAMLGDEERSMGIWVKDIGCTIRPGSCQVEEILKDSLECGMTKKSPAPFYFKKMLPEYFPVKCEESMDDALVDKFRTKFDIEETAPIIRISPVGLHIKSVYRHPSTKKFWLKFFKVYETFYLDLFYFENSSKTSQRVQFTIGGTLPKESLNTSKVYVKLFELPKPTIIILSNAISKYSETDIIDLCDDMSDQSDAFSLSDDDECEQCLIIDEDTLKSTGMDKEDAQSNDTSTHINIIPTTYLSFVEENSPVNREAAISYDTDIIHMKESEEVELNDISHDINANQSEVSINIKSIAENQGANSDNQKSETSLQDRPDDATEDKPTPSQQSLPLQKRYSIIQERNRLLRAKNDQIFLPKRLRRKKETDIIYTSSVKHRLKYLFKRQNIIATRIPKSKCSSRSALISKSTKTPNSVLSISEISVDNRSLNEKFIDPGHCQPTRANATEILNISKVSANNPQLHMKSIDSGYQTQSATATEISANNPSLHRASIDPESQSQSSGADASVALNISEVSANNLHLHRESIDPENQSQSSGADATVALNISEISANNIQVHRESIDPENPSESTGVNANVVLDIPEISANNPQLNRQSIDPENQPPSSGADVTVVLNISEISANNPQLHRESIDPENQSPSSGADATVVLNISEVCANNPQLHRESIDPENQFQLSGADASVALNVSEVSAKNPQLHRKSIDADNETHSTATDATKLVTLSEIIAKYSQLHRKSIDSGNQTNSTATDVTDCLNISEKGANNSQLHRKSIDCDNHSQSTAPDAAEVDSDTFENMRYILQSDQSDLSNLDLENQFTETSSFQHQQTRNVVDPTNNDKNLSSFYQFDEMPLLSSTLVEKIVSAQDGKPTSTTGSSQTINGTDRKMPPINQSQQQQYDAISSALPSFSRLPPEGIQSNSAFSERVSRTLPKNTLNSSSVQLRGNTPFFTKKIETARPDQFTVSNDNGMTAVERIPSTGRFSLDRLQQYIDNLRATNNSDTPPNISIDIKLVINSQTGATEIINMGQTNNRDNNLANDTGGTNEQDASNVSTSSAAVLSNYLQRSDNRTAPVLPPRQPSQGIQRLRCRTDLLDQQQSRSPTLQEATLFPQANHNRLMDEHYQPPQDRHVLHQLRTVTKQTNTSPSENSRIPALAPLRISSRRSTLAASEFTQPNYPDIRQIRTYEQHPYLQQPNYVCCPQMAHNCATIPTPARNNCEGRPVQKKQTRTRELFLQREHGIQNVSSMETGIQQQQSNWPSSTFRHQLMGSGTNGPYNRMPSSYEYNVPSQRQRLNMHPYEQSSSNQRHPTGAYPVHNVNHFGYENAISGIQPRVQIRSFEEPPRARSPDFIRNYRPTDLACMPIVNRISHNAEYFSSLSNQPALNQGLRYSIPSNPIITTPSHVYAANPNRTIIHRPVANASFVSVQTSTPVYPASRNSATTTANWHYQNSPDTLQ